LAGGLTAPLTVTVGDFIARSGIAHNAVYILLRDGELDSICIGTRRLIVWASYLSLIERHGLPRDEAERAAAAEAYQNSLNSVAGRGAAKARAGLVVKQRQASQHLRKPARKQPRRPQAVGGRSV
jgi:hypothetical protein